MSDKTPPPSPTIFLFMKDSKRYNELLEEKARIIKLQISLEEKMELVESIERELEKLSLDS